MPDQSPKPPPAEVRRPRYGGLFDLDAGGSSPYVLPGETVSVASAVGFGAGLASVQVLKRAAERGAPGCVHFGECGGCHYQHAEYGAQLEFKREVLEDVLGHAGLRELPLTRTHHADPWGYRNRIRLRIEPSGGPGAKDLQVGYSRPGSNGFLPIRMCPIAAPLLWRAAQALLLLASEPVCRRWLRSASQVELFCLPDESRLLISLFLRDIEPGHRDPASFPALCQRLREHVPELAGAGAELDPDLNRRVRRSWAGVSWGAAGLAYPAAGRTYWVSRGAFFQVNRFLVDELVALVVEGQLGDLAWDLFAGVGLFARVLAERFARVVAVEGGESATADLTIAARGGKDRPAFEAVHSSTLDFLRARELQRDRPDLIVLDPPRAGLGPEGSAILGRLAAPRMVYVSCDPVTLARDLVILTRGGYRVDALDLVDLFPQTYHIETVVHLSRG